MSEAAAVVDPQGIARTATGEIADAGTPKTTTETKPSSTTTTEAKQEAKPEGDAKTDSKPSLLNEKDKVEVGAPEKYEEFKVPEGFVLDENVSKEVGALFKELNLSQEGGQKLVDFYTAKTVEAAEAPVKLWMDTQKAWVYEIKADKEIGHILPEVKQTISKAIDKVLGSELGKSFREAMDFTGAGNNPAFVKGFFKFAQGHVEGKHVPAGGPSKFGQAAPGKPQDAAHALYPNLP